MAKHVQVIRRAFLLLVVSSCSGGVPVGDAGDLQDSGVLLDGKPLAASVDNPYAGNIVLAAGTHQLEIRNPGNYRLTGNITGLGSLHVSVSTSATLSLEGKQLHQETVLKSGKLSLVDAGYYSGKASVAEGDGVLTKLATPKDISSDLRAWFDASDDSTLFVDLFSNATSTVASGLVSRWGNRARPWPDALVTAGNPTRTADLKSIRLVGAAYEMNDLYLKGEGTIAVVTRPFDQPYWYPVIFSSSFSAATGNLVTIALGGGIVGRASGNPVVGFGSYSLSTAWLRVADYTLATNENVMIVGTIANDGGVLQVNGTTVRANPHVRMNYPSYDAMLGQLKYYIARVWDGSANTYSGEISEIVLVGDGKSREAINGYIAWHNGLQEKLPNDHPYKSAPPIATITANKIVVNSACAGKVDCKELEQPGCAPTCAQGLACINDGDCGSWKCLGGTCQKPTCSPSCKIGQRCGADTDCSTLSCVNNFCKAPSCSPFCDRGAVCTDSSQCAGTCESNLCKDPACAPNCPTNAKCSNDSQCAGVCVNHYCTPPECSPRCQIGTKCSEAAQCASGVCTLNKCAT